MYAELQNVWNNDLFSINELRNLNAVTTLITT